MKKTVGLRTEILVTLTFLLGAALLLGGIMMLRLMEKSLLEERVGQLQSLSHVLAQSLVLNAYDMSLLQQLPDKFNCVGWWVYDPDLNPIDSYVSGKDTPFSVSKRQMAKLSGDPQQKIVFPSLLNLFDQSDPSAHLIIPLKNEKRFYGLLELHFSLADIRLNLLKSQQVIIIYVVLYGIVLILAGYYLLQRNIIKPALNLLKATEEVSRGNLEIRLPSVGPTEFLQLSQAYNRMTEALRTSQSETNRHIQALEVSNQELQQTRNELIRSEKMASVGQLAAGLAHEVGNPLAALIGYLELMKQKITASAEKDIVERSIAEAGRIDLLVRELLDFSRPSKQVQSEPVNLVDVLRSSTQLLDNQGALSDVEICNALPETLPAIQVDQNKLQQVFINLLLNAVQSCEAGAEITLSAGNDNDSIWAEIKDTGAGIAEADLAKIFDPFFTTKSPGEGTGLGLAICQRIVEEAGGMIKAESRLGVGSSFRLVFPVVETTGCVDCREPC